MINAIVNSPDCHKAMHRQLLIPILALLVTACSNAPVQAPGNSHLRAEKVGAGDTASIPAPVQQVLTLPKPKAAAKTETYSVVVNDVPVKELLFALARDAKLNVDIHSQIEGHITLNAIDQTLQQLLNRIAKQADLRWELDGPNLAVMPDLPFLRTYRVDYVNMSRDTSGTVAVTTQIASTGGGAGGTGSSTGGSGGGNNSLTKIENKAQNHFWDTLEKNIKDILRETDKVLPEGSSETVVERQDQQATTGTGVPPAPVGGRSTNAGQTLAASPNPAALQQSGTTVTRRSTFREAASVIVNPETGIVNVRATGRQHEKIQEFIDQVMASARRQVLIEATVAEVTLSQNYQQGIDWSRVRADTLATGLSLIQTGSSPSGAGLFTIDAKRTTAGGVFSATLKLLENYGTVKVLSSPKLSVLNNQTAMLKVVDNLAYFTIKADTATSNTSTTTTYTTNLYSVPVGLVMNVTPQISSNDSVLLNIRPSISRKYGSVIDPHPELQRLGIKNEIPVIRTREMESILRIDNGNIAVMGGLMEDSVDNADQGVPGLSAIPIIGNLFQNRNDTKTKTELVVFLRPVIIKDASIQGDYADYREQLPDQHFFGKDAIGQPRQVFDFGSAKQ